MYSVCVCMWRWICACVYSAKCNPYQPNPPQAGIQPSCAALDSLQLIFSLWNQLFAVQVDPRPQVFNSLTLRAWRRHSLSFRLTSKEMSDDIHRDAYWFSLFHLRGESLVQILICPWAEVSGRAGLRHRGESPSAWLPSDSEVGDPLWVFLSVWIKSARLTYQREMCCFCHGYREKKTLFYCCDLASSSDTVEQWGGRNKTAQHTGSRGQPVAFPTTFLTHPQLSFAFFFFCLGSLQTGYSWQTAGNKSSHLTPKRKGRESAV